MYVKSTSISVQWGMECVDVIFVACMLYCILYFQPGYGRILSLLESVVVAGRLSFDSWTTIQHSLLCAHRYGSASTINYLIQFGIYCVCID